MNVITAIVRLSFAHIQRCLSEHYKSQPFWLRPKMLLFIFIPTILAQVIPLFWKNAAAKNLFMPIITVCVFGWILLAVFFLNPRRARRNWVSNPSCDSDAKWEFSEGRVVFTSADTKQEFAWQALFAIVQRTEGLLIYTAPNLFHWVPRSSFQTNEDWKLVTGIAERLSPRFRRSE